MGTQFCTLNARREMRMVFLTIRRPYCCQTSVVAPYVTQPAMELGEPNAAITSPDIIVPRRTKPLARLGHYPESLIENTAKMAAQIQDFFLAA